MENETNPNSHIQTTWSHRIFDKAVDDGDDRKAAKIISDVVQSYLNRIEDPNQKEAVLALLPFHYIKQ